MNKADVIAALKDKTGYSEEQCIVINDVLENTFIFGRKNKKKMIAQFMERLELDEQAAEKLYEDAMSVIGGGIMHKIRRPLADDKKK